MRITKKKFLGLLGLFGVVAVTTIAILLPQTGVSAVTSQSVTDTIEVTITGDKPRVEIVTPKDGERLTGPVFNVAFTSEGGVEGGRVTIERLSGGTHEIKELDTYTSKIRATPGIPFSVDLEELFPENHGYGEYEIKVTGTVNGDVVTESIIHIIYNAVNPGGETGGTEPGGETPEFPTDGETGDPVIDPGVSGDNKYVDHTHVSIFPVGNKGDVPGAGAEPKLSENVPNGATWTAPFAKNCLTPGWYYILTEAVDAEGNIVGMPEGKWFYWAGSETCGELPVAILGSPNTGGLFGGVNVSREDALLTGLIVFLAAAGLGTLIVIRKNKKAKATSRRKRR